MRTSASSAPSPSASWYRWNRAARLDLTTRHERYATALGLSADEADLLSGDTDTADYFDAAVVAGAKPGTAARWLLNDLAGLVGDRPLATLSLDGAAFGRFAALVDAGRLAPAGAKALLADLVAKGGEPEARMRALGVEKVEDRGAVEAAVAKALAAHAKEAERYRAGEKKLFGVLVGAAMKASGGAADAALVRKVLEEKLR